MNATASPARSALAVVVTGLLLAAAAVCFPQEAQAAASYWTHQDTATLEDISGLSVADRGHALAVGDNGLILKWNGTAWNSQSSGTTDDYRGVACAGRTRAWAVGLDGKIRYFNGTSWVGQASGTWRSLHDISAFDASNVWAVGEFGTILRYNGVAWSNVSGSSVLGFLGVDVIDPNCVMWVGEQGYIGQYRDGAWSSFFPVPTTEKLRGISALDRNNAWAVGANGTILRYQGGTWKAQASGTTEHLRKVCAVNANNVWAVGYKGTVLRWDGSSWKAQDSGTSCKLREVDAADADNVWAAGAYGTILHGSNLPPSLSTWYLAEGSTAWGYSTSIGILNPNDEAVTARVTYMTDRGPVDGGNIQLRAQSQKYVFPRDVLGEMDFSTRVVCNEKKPIAVDRNMFWGEREGASDMHGSIGVTSPWRTWYLPEGSSAWGFETWLLIQNPGNTVANCTVTYMIEGREPETRVKKVPANSRRTYSMRDDIGEADASIRVESDVPVIPERSMYWGDRRGGHDSIGTTRLSHRYYLAEGTTAWGFTTYLMVQNPHKYETTVTVTYMTNTGPRQMEQVTMEPNSRKTIRMNDEPGMAGTDASTMVEGSKPIIAERSMYWNNGTGWAGHDSVGLPRPYSTFYLPSGQADSRYETWTLVQNPGGADVQVEVSYLKQSGGSVSFRDVVPAGSRKTYNMAEKGSPMCAGVVVRSLTTGRKIMVERAIYRDQRGGGSDTIGGYSD